MSRIFLTILLACVTSCAHAQLFKCKHADGSATFQDTECPDGSVSTKLAMPATSSAQSIALTPDTLGHYYALVSINNVTVKAIVDTGASSLTLSSNVARSMGISLSDSQPGYVQTANGVTTSYVKTMPVVKIGDIEIYNVEVSILAATPTLIGMSALKKFKIHEENGQMVLEKK